MLTLENSGNSGRYYKQKSHNPHHFSECDSQVCTQMDIAGICVCMCAQCVHTGMCECYIFSHCCRLWAAGPLLLP